MCDIFIKVSVLDINVIHNMYAQVVGRYVEPCFGAVANYRCSASSMSGDTMTSTEPLRLIIAVVLETSSVSSTQLSTRENGTNMTDTAAGLSGTSTLFTLR